MNDVWAIAYPWVAGCAGALATELGHTPDEKGFYFLAAILSVSAAWLAALAVAARRSR